MLLRLSTKAETQKVGAKHLVLHRCVDEMARTLGIVNTQILTDGKKPVMEFDAARSGDWLTRFNLRYLEKIIAVFPNLELSANIQSGLKKKQAEENEKTRAIDNATPHIHVPYLDYSTLEGGDLAGFQRRALQLCLDNKNFMVNMDVGTGKTNVALSAIFCLDAFPALVITTNSGKWAWEKIIQKHFPTFTDYQLVNGTKAERISQIEKNAALTIINIEGLRVKKLSTFLPEDQPFEYAHESLFVDEDGDSFEWPIVIFDETHRVKNINTQAATGFLQIKHDRLVTMSGSPFLNAPEELWTALHKMDAARFPTQHNFTKWLTNQTREGKVIGYRPEAMAELTSFLDTCSFRRRRDEVRDDLPQLVYSSFSVELTAEQRRLYEKIKNQLILEIEEDERKGERTVFPSTVQLRLGQACFSPELYGGSKHSAKLDELHRIVEELVSNGEKAIIFSKWAKATRIMQRELAKYNPAYVDGSVKGADRNEQQDKFNNDPACHVYIGTIKANQEAITLNAATYVIFTDIEWSPLANHQAAGRSAAGGLRGINLGEDVKVNIIEIRGHDTIDESIAVYLAKKQKLFDQVIDSNRIERTMRLNISDIKALLK